MKGAGHTQQAVVLLHSGTPTKGPQKSTLDVSKCTRPDCVPSSRQRANCSAFIAPSASFNEDVSSVPPPRCLLRPFQTSYQQSNLPTIGATRSVSILARGPQLHPRS
jgi:hypothetical protein